jgi:hypothetical protein
MQVSPLAKIHKVLWRALYYFENLFLTVLLWHFEFYKKLQICLKRFGAKMQKLWSKTERKKNQKKGERQPLGRPGNRPKAQQAKTELVPAPFLSLPLVGGTPLSGSSLTSDGFVWPRPRPRSPQSRFSWAPDAPEITPVKPETCPSSISPFSHPSWTVKPPNFHTGVLGCCAHAGLIPTHQGVLELSLLAYFSSLAPAHHPMPFGHPILQKNKHFTATRRSPSSSPPPAVLLHRYWMPATSSTTPSTSPSPDKSRRPIHHLWEPLHRHHRPPPVPPPRRNPNRRWGNFPFLCWPLDHASTLKISSLMRKGMGKSWPRRFHKIRWPIITIQPNRYQRIELHHVSTLCSNRISI